ncbi:MAG TPA: helix-hairpin-helix domain-containing protein [Candidatus Omnitrophota bacterium]|mgnify:CR=1|nr:helix-hairpin-helix domain-containing protein [Candidatus Omnitrophota bacterium]
MISKIRGKFIERRDQAVILEVGGIFYEILVSDSVMGRIEDRMGPDACLELITYYYIQIGPAKGNPVLVGFLNEIEKDFFLDFIKVSGIGPRAAIKALNQPISTIAEAIVKGEEKFLTALPGIGKQKAKEIVAKLQNKVGKYGLIQDEGPGSSFQAASKIGKVEAWQEEALEVLLQLQYKKAEAQQMIEKALERNASVSSAEQLLNEIYKQRIAAHG